VILLLDHDDSFVHTLAAYIAELGQRPRVIRAHDTTLDEIASLGPSHIILSPGPRTPRECPLAIDVVRTLGRTVPVLGVCLGHQCIAAAFGGTVERTPHPTHGEAASIAHDGAGVFRGLPIPFRAARYHSLAVDASTLPAELMITARADDGDVMGIRHRAHRIEGVQFHPESVLTEWGHRLLANFIAGPALSFTT
jgi:anthranilate synthase/aminodeoxychorismate synthase-like glutamine amidotransferase